MIALLLGVIFLNQDYDQSGMRNINSVLFLFLTNMSFNNVFGVVNVSNRILKNYFLFLLILVNSYELFLYSIN